MKKIMKNCEWCDKKVDIKELEEAGGCDIIPKGLMCCENCINIKKGVDENE